MLVEEDDELLVDELVDVLLELAACFPSRLIPLYPALSLSWPSFLLIAKFPASIIYQKVTTHLYVPHIQMYFGISSLAAIAAIVYVKRWALRLEPSQTSFDPCWKIFAAFSPQG